MAAHHGDIKQVPSTMDRSSDGMRRGGSGNGVAWSDPDIQRRIKGCHRRLIKSILSALVAAVAGGSAAATANAAGCHHILVDISSATVPPTSVALQALAEVS
jgi:hypothetical protein